MKSLNAIPSQPPMYERQLRYWETQLRGCPAVDLPTDRPRPGIPSHRGGRTEFFLPQSLADSLRDLHGQESVTLFELLLAALQVLLSRYSGSEDIVVGTTTAGRNRPGTEELAGTFVNTLALRTNLAGRPTFREFLKRVRQTCRDAHQYQDLPFDLLLAALRSGGDANSPPIFQVALNLQDPAAQRFVAPAPGPGLGTEELGLTHSAAAPDLTLNVAPRGRDLACSFLYNADLFDGPTIERLKGHYITLLEAIVAEPESPIASLPLLTAAERHQILVEWNRTAVDYPREATIQERFEAQAERIPQALALTFQDQNLTYGDLNRRANELAHQLRSAGVRPETRIGLLLGRSPDMVIGLLAVLKAGGACVPLDPSYPDERLAFMLEDAGVEVLLTHEHLRRRLPERDLKVICLDSLKTAATGGSLENPRCAVRPDNLAYVLYTSGSTGMPKGVEVLHRGIVRLVCGTDYIDFGPDEVFLQYCSISFDASTFEIWGALLHGGRCVLHPHPLPDLAQLRSLLESEKVTTMMITPSLFNTVIDTAPQTLSAVRQLLIAGETPSPPHIRRALSLLPGTDLINAYGPTEATTLTCCHRIPRNPEFVTSPIPIGRPIANTQVYIFDRHMQPVPVGVVGELYVGGDGLARGYLNQPEITARKFIPNPYGTQPEARLYQTGDLCRYLPDGNIEFLGRLDNQVKIRGFRIEPGEIESALAEHPAVSAAVVEVREDTPGDKRLVAYIVPHAAASAPAPQALREALKQRLPEYMVPADIVTLDALPLTPNGKVDRRALPLQSRSRQAGSRYVPARDPQEAELVKIWEAILNVRPIGIEDDFFDLGGHSLLAVRMMARLEEAYRDCPPITSLFAEATIKHLADCLRKVGPREARQAIVPIQPLGARPPFFFLHGDHEGGIYCRKLARLLGPDQPFYGVMPNGFDGGPLLPSIEAMAEENLGRLVAVQPRGPYLLGGFCRGGLVAYEMARQMRQRGLPVGLVVLLDAAVPRPLGWLEALLRPGDRRDCDGQNRVQNQLHYYLLRTHAASHGGLGAVMALYREAILTRLARLLGRRAEEPGGPGPAFGGILINYRPKPYSGRVVLLRTKSLQSSSPADWTAGWGELASQIDVHEVPGDHDTCRTDHVGAVAELIDKSLRSPHQKPQRALAQPDPS